MSEIVITDEMLSDLRVRVKPYMREKRYLHTLAVERECAALAAIYLPEREAELRAAALLHDITKMLSLEKQLKYCEIFYIIYGKDDLASPKLFHAKTAPAVIKRDFPEFASEEILSGVRWHTTGRRGMSLFETIVYLADYIEDTRTFDDCVELRRFFYDALAKGDEPKDKVLCRTMIRSFDLTISNLISEESPVDLDTVDARNCFIGCYREKYL
ncbi:MAG: HD domain-containing protein [Clostridia bacterium]|nr:HD domain-containing protein [Clostridia bacterium]